MKKTIIVAEDEQDIREILCFAISIQGDYEVLQANDGLEAIELLKKNKHIDLIICDYNMPDINGGEVFKFLHEQKLNTHYVLCSSDSPKDHKVFEGHKMFGYIQKPDIMGGLDIILNNLHQTAVPKEEFKIQFLPFSFYLAKKFNQAPCDYFIKLSDEKVLKVIKRGDVMTDADIEKYSAKNVEHFFIEYHDAEGILNQLSSSIANVFNNSTISGASRLSSVQELLSDYASLIPFHPEILKQTQDGINNALKDFDQDKKIKKLVENILLLGGTFLSKYAVLCCYFSDAIVENLEEFSKNKIETKQKLVMASLLQDISLDSQEFNNIQVYDRYLKKDPLLGSEKLNQFYNHPNKSASMLMNSKLSIPDLEKMLLEQHELHNGQGYPKRLTGNQISLVSSVLIMANCLSEVILRNENIMDELELDLLLNSLNFDYNEDKQVQKIVKSLRNSVIFS